MVTERTPARKAVIILLAILVLILGAGLLYLQYNVLRSAQAAVEEEELAVDVAQARFLELTAHRASADEYRRRISYAESMIPAEPGEGDILRYLERMAEDYELGSMNISFGARSSSEDHVVMPLSLTLESDYTGLIRFLAHLHGGKRAFRVNDIRIVPVNGPGPMLRVSLSAAVFFQLPD